MTNLTGQNESDNNSVQISAQDLEFTGYIQANTNFDRGSIGEWVKIPATSDSIGMVKPGTNLSVELDGTLNADTYSKTQIDNLLLTKANSNAIPTKVSELSNDSNYVPQTTMESELGNKQATLVSGTNIKTINNNSILGSGNLELNGLPIQTGNSGKFLTTNGSIASWSEVNGISRNIGEVVASTIPLTDAGLHLLDGSLIQGGGVYADFVTYIAGLYTSGDYTAIFDTEANWQAAVTANGVCGKFVYDSVNNTVRLPKYSNKIYTQDIDTTAPVVGNGMTLGLTSGTNNFGVYGHSSSGYLAGASALYGSSVGVSGSGANVDGKTLGVTTDTTKSGIIADLSNITTSLEGYYYIVIATSTKTNIEVDIDNVVTDLNNKADKDFSNVTNYLPSGTTITVGTSSARFSTLADAFSYLSGKWSDGYVTISITTNLTVTDDLELFTSDFNIPLLIINGNSNTITLNFTTANTYTCGFRIYNQNPVQVSNVNFVGGTNGTTHILAGGYYTSSLLFSGCSFDNAYGGVFAYNVADVKVEGCTLLALSVGMQAQQGGTIVSRGCTFGASGKKCVTCYSVYVGGVVRGGESTYTNYTNQGTQNTNTITSSGLIMLA